MGFRKPPLRPLPDSEAVAEFANAAPVGTRAAPPGEAHVSERSTELPWETHDPTSKSWRSTSLRLNEHDLARLHWIAKRYNRSAQWVLREFVRSCMDTEIEFLLTDEKKELASFIDQAPPGARRILERMLRSPLSSSR